MQRSSYWSITINNPTDQDLQGTLPPGWTLQGQHEEGKEGTLHFQGMLHTPQVRFSAVKKQFARAHIEIARNPKALQEYVHKADTRVSTFETKQTDNIFQSQAKVCELFNWEHWKSIKPDVNHRDYKVGDTEKCLMRVIDGIVRDLILSGERGIEFTAINPMWRSSWLKFGEAILYRELYKDQTDTISINEDDPNYFTKEADDEAH